MSVKLTAAEAAERWRRGMDQLAQLGYTGQTAADLLQHARAAFISCNCCGAPYRPDPRRVWQCAYCGAQDWRRHQ